MLMTGYGGKATGAFSIGQEVGRRNFKPEGYTTSSTLRFDASDVVDTASEVRPYSFVALPLIAY